MLGEMWNVITTGVSSFVSTLVSAFNGIGGMLVTTSGTGSSITYEPTFLGICLLATISTGIVVWAFSLIRGAVKGIAG